jgi:hypothetical protein
MRNIYCIIVSSFILCTPLKSVAGECWAVSNIKGYSAYADQKYKFIEDGMKSILICFTPDGGSVTGSDIRFVKFENSTLAGYGGNDRGNELFEVYQLDRGKKKLLYTKTRIGTKTITPLFSDVVSSFVGDAKKVND